MNLIGMHVLRRLKRRRAFYWRRVDGLPNVGDELAIPIVQFMIGQHSVAPWMKLLMPGQRLLSIGSVLHFAKAGDCIWGTGRNVKIPESLHAFHNLDVRAVRGPRTLEFLRRRGISADPVFGDPGILAPLIYNVQHNNKDIRILYVPHMDDKVSDIRSIVDKYDVHVLSPLMSPNKFINTLTRAQKVISGSLHGIVLSEAFGIPVSWYKCDTEPEFKYIDYYEGTGRFGIDHPQSFDQCVYGEPPQLPPVRKIQEALISSFPIDIWHLNTSRNNINKAII